MAGKRKSTKYILLDKCGSKCSVSEVNIGKPRATLLHGWFEAGQSDHKIEDLARAAGFTVTAASVGRHFRNHLIEADQVELREDYAEMGELEALQQAIKQGQKNMGNWKMTPSEWMKALELYMKFTEGTVYDGLLDAMELAEFDEETDDRQEGLGTLESGPGSVREVLPEQPAPPGAGELAQGVE